MQSDELLRMRYGKSAEESARNPIVKAPRLVRNGLELKTDASSGADDAEAKSGDDAKPDADAAPSEASASEEAAPAAAPTASTESESSPGDFCGVW